MLRMLSALVMTCTMSSIASAERATEDVLKLCRSMLVSEKHAVVPNWSTKPLPQDLRKLAGIALRDSTVAGWTAHRNPNRSRTIVIRASDPETDETSFVVLTGDEDLTLKDTVFAFEFAFSKIDHDGVTGLFFCSKTGPSKEWVWNGADWQVAR